VVLGSSRSMVNEMTWQSIERKESILVNLDTKYRIFAVNICVYITINWTLSMFLVA
jgi:hypothetical protein